MLYSEIIAVCSQIHTKHINTLCGQNVESLNVKLVVYTRVVPKVSVLICYLNVYWTHLKLQVISFKV
jgi:hypothetical protein